MHKEPWETGWEMLILMVGLVLELLYAWNSTINNFVHHNVIIKTILRVTGKYFLTDLLGFYNGIDIISTLQEYEILYCGACFPS